MLFAVDGLGMLLHQAVPGFARWFGITPEVTPELRRIPFRSGHRWRSFAEFARGTGRGRPQSYDSFLKII